MTIQTTARLALLSSLLALPTLPLVGCGGDTHSTATGLPKKTGLEPGNGPNGSGSVATETVNSGGPGAKAEPK